MLFINNGQISSAPITDLLNSEIDLENLCAAIDEYIVNHRQKTLINGEPAEVLPVSGMAEWHHENLAKYLNTNVFSRRADQASLREGSFANYPMKHFWIQAGDLIIDLAIRQFSDKPINAFAPIRQILDCRYFICDNPENAVYRLYQE